MKWLRSNSPACPGRASTLASQIRPKRIKTIAKAKVCIFSSSKFCPSDDSELLHRVLSDSMGKNFLTIRNNTQDNQAQTCVSDLQDADDTSAPEKHYHNKCLQYAQRTCTPVIHDTAKLIRSVCDEESIITLLSIITDDDVTVTMTEVNSTYLSILKRYHMEISETANYQKYLKQLITNHIPSVQIINPLQKNEPETVIIDRVLTKAIKFHSHFLDDDATISVVKKAGQHSLTDAAGLTPWLVIQWQL